MKRFNFMRSLSLLLLVLCIHMQAQHPFLSQLTARVAGEGVFVEWTINQGSTCLGITIERAGPDKVFSEVGRIKEACGSIDEPIDYDFLDENPLQGVVSYYRLILGLDGTTEPIAVQYFAVDVSGFSITMDQGSGLLSVFSLRPFEKKNSLVIYDITGRELERVSLSDNIYTMDVTDQNTGILLAAILDEDEVIYLTRILKTR